jgi:hypothetical protein
MSAGWSPTGTRIRPGRSTSVIVNNDGDTIRNRMGAGQRVRERRVSERHRASDIERATSSERHRAGDIERATSSGRHRASDIERATSSERHRAGDIERATSSTRRDAVGGRTPENRAYVVISIASHLDAFHKRRHGDAPSDTRTLPFPTTRSVSAKISSFTCAKS